MPRRRVETREDWERVIGAASRLQRIVEGTVLVGGSAAAMHVAHRFSYDDDHIATELRDRFDEVLASLEQAAGWKLARIRRPVLILGSLDGVETGIRQLQREAPLETEFVDTAGGPILIPTLPEMLRIKAWLVVSRNATRDYVDTVALASRLRELEGSVAVVSSLLPLDTLYPQETGESVVRQFAKQLAEPLPYDFESVAFGELRGLSPQWATWDAVVAASCELAAELEIGRAENA